MQASESFFEKFCQRVTLFIGSHAGSVLAFIILTGGLVLFIVAPKSPLADMANKLMTMVSLVLLFFLQRSQTKDTLSLQIKLNELIKVEERADSALINVEHKSEEELKALHDDFNHTAEQAQEEKHT